MFWYRIVFAVLLTFMVNVRAAGAETTILPIRLDYPLIRSFFVQQLFNEPGEVATLVWAEDSCTSIVLREPKLEPHGMFLRLQSRMSVKTGMSIFNICAMPVEWHGYIDAVQQVRLDMPDWTLRFQTKELRFSNLQREPYKLTEVLWNLVRKRLEGQFDQLSVNLLPSIAEIQGVVPQFFHDENKDRITKFLQTIRPGDVSVMPDYCNVDILMNTDFKETLAADIHSETPLNDEELARFVQTWEIWDAFLVFELRQLGRFKLDDEERGEILRILLETRYQVINELSSDYVYSNSDLVRIQFMRSWEKLAPIFRRHLTRDTSSDPLAILVYVSAVDALTTLDRIGPHLGMEISRDGLVRLARLLVEDDAQVDLSYSYESDEELRSILGWDKAPVVTGPVYSGQELELTEPAIPSEEERDDVSPVDEQPEKLDDGAYFVPEIKLLIKLVELVFQGVPSAFAAEGHVTELQSFLKAWIVDKANVTTYHEKVRGILRDEAKRVTASSKFPPERRDMFEKLIHATGWQESCFRQFHVNDGKITYLRSWNNSSVGMMQINERVWRGLYNIDALRWDPHYNIRAGAEIMREYLSRYVLKKSGPVSNLDEDGTVRAAYAIYNSGPAGLDAFLSRHANNEYSKTDALFWNKYLLTKSGKFDRLGECL